MPTPASKNSTAADATRIAAKDPVACSNNRSAFIQRLPAGFIFIHSFYDSH